MTKVVYILGAGRSGSTLLERLLSSAPGVAALGEAHCLWRLDIGALSCACGAPVADCDFWLEVRRKAGFCKKALSDLAALERRAVRHVAIAAAGFNLKRFQAHPDIQEFRTRQSALFAAAAEVAGAETLIDASKAAPRAWALAGLDGVPVLRLTRSPRDVIASWRRFKTDPGLGGPMRRKGFAHAMGEWMRAETSARLLAAQTPMTAIRFEHLAAAPRETLAAAGLRFAEGVRWIGPRTFLPDEAYHAINGNPMRFDRGPIEIRPPRSAMTRNDDEREAPA